jgi:hypothetical protein
MPLSPVAVDHLNWKVNTTLRKWDRSEDFDAGLEPNAVEHYEDNLLLNAGITRLLNLLGGAGGTAFNAANTRIGVGNGTAAAVATQTDLQGASKQFELVNGAPTITNQTIEWVATFESADANFAWEEWVIDNGTVDGVTVTAPALNRKVQVMGTKASGSTWTFTVSITIS